MKVLLYFQDASLYPLVIEAIGTDHFIEEVKKDYNLIHAIAQCTPHLLVAQEPASEDIGLFDELKSVFPALSVCLLADLSSGTQWHAKLREFLAQAIPRETTRPYADDFRVVWLDETFGQYDKGKLKRPEQKPGWEKECSQQEARFLLQLEGGQRNQAAAEDYLQCLLDQQTGLDQEIAYRLAHGSFRALSWSRDLAIRWLALLAHYVPDVELEYLPKPAAPALRVDFVHHNIRPEGIYAATLILLSKVDRAIGKAIMPSFILRRWFKLLKRYSCLPEWLPPMVTTFTLHRPDHPTGSISGARSALGIAHFLKRLNKSRVGERCIVAYQKFRLWRAPGP